MAHRRRRAEYIATLIYLDEPQLLAMKDGTTRILALAVPSEDPAVARFVATTVSKSNWESYFDGNTDLRFLFTFPTQKLTYYFDLMKMIDGRVMMDPHLGAIPETDLPSPRLFASEHTSDFSIGERSNDEQTLLIDGEWDIPEFGDFYQRFCDLYSFSAATRKWNDPQADVAAKRRIESTFRDKPFQGGSSYVHFYRELTSRLNRVERPALESIAYASPGTVKILGQDDLFGDVERLIKRCLGNRREIDRAYHELEKYLSQHRLLRLAGENFAVNDPLASPIRTRSEKLCAEMGLVEHETIRELAMNNDLVAAKIVLSLKRRLIEATTFFAQGRMTYRN